MCWCLRTYQRRGGQRHDRAFGRDRPSFAEGKLARYKLPKELRLVEALPRNPTGKILKRVLRDTYETSLTAPE